MVDAVIFDWDGTLANTQKAVVNAFIQVLREVGCEVDPTFIQRRIGIGTQMTLEAALKERRIEVTAAQLNILIKKKVERQTQLADTVELFDGATELLHELYGRTRLALATMSAREVVEKLLTIKGIANLFEVVVTADDVANPKPDPMIFLVTAEKLKANPKACVVIEDSVFGVKAAQAAGMNCIAISSGAYTARELRRENPNVLIHSLRQKDEILKFLFQET